MYSGDEYYSEDFTTNEPALQRIHDIIKDFVTFDESGKAKLLPPEQLPRMNMMFIIEMVMRYNRGERFV